MQVQEGAVTLALPDRDIDESGPSERAGAFYNPAMATSRDLGVLVHRELVAVSVLDGLAGAGARGLRLAAEADVDVHLNDVNPQAVETIRRNADLNDLDVEATRLDLAEVLAKGGDWDVVDVDPYGTPEPWIDPALSALGPGDVLAFSATDTAVLHGHYADVLEQRYGAELVRQDAATEIGVRVLVGYVARRASEQGMGVEPVLAFSLGHHVRAWLRLTGEPGEIGSAYRCPSCREAWLDGDGCSCEDAPKVSGPLWTGLLGDPDVVDDLAADDDLAEPEAVGRLLDRLVDDVAGPPLYVDVHRLGEQRSCSLPSMDDLLEALEEEGYVASRTHFADTAVKTDAPRDVVGSLVERLGSGS